MSEFEQEEYFTTMRGNIEGNSDDSRVPELVPSLNSFNEVKEDTNLLKSSYNKLVKSMEKVSDDYVDKWYADSKDFLLADENGEIYKKYSLPGVCWRKSNLNYGITKLFLTKNRTLIGYSNINDIGLYYSLDCGKTWVATNIANGKFDKVAEYNGAIVINCITPRSFYENGAGLLYTNDAGKTWYQSNVDIGIFNTIKVVEGRFYACSKSNKGLFYSTEGYTWRSVDGEVDLNNVVFDVNKIGNRYYCTGYRGLYSSIDGMNDWRLIYTTDASSQKIHSITKFGNVYVGAFSDGVKYSTDLLIWNATIITSKCETFYAFDQVIYAKVGTALFKSMDGIEWIKFDMIDLLDYVESHDGILCIIGRKDIVDRGLILEYLYTDDGLDFDKIHPNIELEAFMAVNNFYAGISSDNQSVVYSTSEKADEVIATTTFVESKDRDVIRRFDELLDDERVARVNKDNEFEGRITTNTNNISSLTNQVGINTSNIADLTEELTATKGRVSTLETGLNKEINDRIDEVTRLDGRVNDTNSLLETTINNLNSVGQRVDTNTDNININRADISTVNSKLNTEIDDRTQADTALSIRIDTNTNDIRNLTDTVNSHLTASGTKFQELDATDANHTRDISKLRQDLNDEVLHREAAVTDLDNRVIHNSGEELDISGLKYFNDGVKVPNIDSDANGNLVANKNYVDLTIKDRLENIPVINRADSTKINYAVNKRYVDNSISQSLQEVDTPVGIYDAANKKYVDDTVSAEASERSVADNTISAKVESIENVMVSVANVNQTIDGIKTFVRPKSNYYPTENSDLATKEYVDDNVTTVYRFKGTKSYYGDLPTSGNKVGDTWNITYADTTHGIKAGDNVVWVEENGTGKWDNISGIFDLTADYYDKGQVDQKVQALRTDINNNTSRITTLESSEATDASNITNLQGRMTTAENNINTNANDIVTLNTDIAALQINKADDSTVVHKSGVESISGIKTFNDKIVANHIESNEIKKSVGDVTVEATSGKATVAGGSGKVEVTSDKITINKITDVSDNRVTNVGNPTVATDAANKGYVDETVENKVVNIPTPTSGLHAANKKYVDDKAASLYTDLSTIATDSEGRDETLDGRITTEVLRATSTEEGLNTRLTAAEGNITSVNSNLGSEVTRATTAESELSDRIDTVQGDILSLFSNTVMKTGDQSITGEKTFTSVTVGTKLTAPVPVDPTDAATKSYVDNKISTVYKFKGSKSNVSQLPVTGNETGDVYNVVNAGDIGGVHVKAGDNVVWDGSAWDPLGGVFDPSGLTADIATAKSEAISSAVASASENTTSAINALNVSDAKVSKKFVTKVSETAGKISVERDELVKTDIPNIDESQVTNLVSDLAGKVDKVSGKDLSTNDYSTAEKTKLSGIETGAQVNKIESVKVDGTALTISSKSVNIDLSGKVDKISGKGLSENDFTTVLKSKLDGISSGANKVTESATNGHISIDGTDTTVYSILSDSEFTTVKSKVSTLEGYDLNTKVTANTANISTLSGKVTALEGVDAGTRIASLESEITTKVDSTYVDTAISTAVASVYRFKGTVANYSNLPNDAEIGDVYNVTNADSDHGVKAGDNLAKTASGWDNLSGIFNTTGLATQTFVTDITGPLGNRVTTAETALGTVDTRISTAVNNAAETTLESANAYADSLAGDYDAAGTASNAISALKTELNTADTASDKGFVTSVSQTNGKISVTRRDLVIGDLPTIQISNISGLQSALDNKVSVVSGKGLSTEDFTASYKTKLEDIAAGAEVNTINVVKVNGTALSITASDRSVNIDLSGKVDKDGSKVLSTNDFTDVYKNQLDTLATTIGNYATKTEVNTAKSDIIGQGTDASSANTIYGIRKLVSELDNSVFTSKTVVSELLDAYDTDSTLFDSVEPVDNSGFTGDLLALSEAYNNLANAFNALVNVLKTH